ncbi:MAG: gamma-glutamyltransferase [Gammaproteobacteria bacterium]
MTARSPKGVVAAGHPATARAAATLLEEGGNAFDAVLGALLTACVAEPVLASLGGGGFLLAVNGNDTARLYDFFAHTPRNRRPASEIDFHPIIADFGTTTQEFHIGLGSIATPGVVRGIFAIHNDLGRMPLAAIAAPALAAARDGIEINPLQSYIFDVVGAIYRATSDSVKVFGSPERPGELIGEGELLRMPQFADFLEVLVREGERLFYEGEVARRIAADCADGGGYLELSDLEYYQVERREPLGLDYHEARILTNPPPSSGGLLIAFALKLLEHCRLGQTSPGSHQHLSALIHAMQLTNKARIDAELHRIQHQPQALKLLDHPFIESYRTQLLGRASCNRGTTHISVMDGEGGVASMTVSNGEGSSYLVPETGIMLNNMLGEEDLNPQGFHLWECNQRIASMMAPTIVHKHGAWITACGSGGSNRIRTAILQFLVNSIDFGMDIEQAVHAPRLHFERELLNIEPGYERPVIKALKKEYPQQKNWDTLNLFFGGVHAVTHKLSDDTLDGVGDPRRGGIAIHVD